MSLIIRLSRVGRRGENHNRIIVNEKRSKRDGKPIEILGWYNKTEKGSTHEINKERYAYWVSKGAIPSQTVKAIVK